MKILRLEGSARARGDPGSGAGGSRRLLGLPEDRGSAPHLGEHELRTGEPWSVEYQVDHGSATLARKGRGLFDHLGPFGPGTLEGVAVDAGGPRPGVSGLQHQTSLDRQLDQIGQLAVLFGVAGDQEDGPRHLAQAARYSLIPGRTSCLRSVEDGIDGGSSPRTSGAESPIPRWGRWEL